MTEKPLPHQPTNGVLVLPPQVVLPPKSNVQLKTYKAQNNMKHDLKTQIVNIINKCDVSIKPNESLLAVIDFKHEYATLPLVETLYPVCGDDEFDLQFMLKEITTKTMTLKVNNKLDKPRNVTFYYKIVQN